PALEAAGGIVDAGVDDPGVVATLMRGHPRLLLEHDDPRRPVAREHRPGRRQADETTADDAHVDAFHAPILPEQSRETARNGRETTVKPGAETLLNMNERPTTMATPAVRAEGLVRTFGGQRAVDGVDLCIAPGEI